MHKVINLDTGAVVAAYDSAQDAISLEDTLNRVCSYRQTTKGKQYHAVDCGGNDLSGIVTIQSHYPIVVDNRGN